MALFLANDILYRTNDIQALDRLHKRRDEVEVTILQEPVHGTFGIGNKYAIIRVTVLPARGGAVITPETADSLRVGAVEGPPEKSMTSIKDTRPITIFYCYAHEDRNLRDRIDKHLGVLKRTGQITGWYDREIQAGTEWEREIEEHLSTASIILLLVSADFVNSEYCYGVEMQKALEMHEKGKARVLPILLRPVDWQGAPFAKLQILPTGAKPITKWLDPEEALEDVAKQIRAVVNTLLTHQS